MNATSLRRFLTQIDDSAGPDACWPWLGATRADGYGVFGLGPQRRAHRISYQRAVGPIPRELVLDHLCRNRSCVNPAHLEPVTQRTNILRSPISLPTLNAAKTHCLRGHRYTPENTYPRVKANGLPNRECRTCRQLLRRKAVA